MEAGRKAVATTAPFRHTNTRAHTHAHQENYSLKIAAMLTTTGPTQLLRTEASGIMHTATAVRWSFKRWS